MHTLKSFLPLKGNTAAGAAVSIPQTHVLQSKRVQLVGNHGQKQQEETKTKVYLHLWSSKEPNYTHSCATPGSGVRMSENKTTPSGLNACQGCRVISTWQYRGADRQ
jgi:hypothetical protein